MIEVKTMARPQTPIYIILLHYPEGPRYLYNKRMLVYSWELARKFHSTQYARKYLKSSSFAQGKFEIVKKTGARKKMNHNKR